MTKKHYAAIADAIRDEFKAWANVGALTPDVQQAIACVAESLAELFAKENPKFDKGKFFEPFSGFTS